MQRSEQSVTFRQWHQWHQLHSRDLRLNHLQQSDVKVQRPRKPLLGNPRIWLRILERLQHRIFELKLLNNWDESLHPLLRLSHEQKTFSA